MTMVMVLRAEVNRTLISKVAIWRSEDQNDEGEYRYVVYDTYHLEPWMGIREGEKLGEFWYHPSESTVSFVTTARTFISEDQYYE